LAAARALICIVALKDLWLQVTKECLFDRPIWRGLFELVLDWQLQIVELCLVLGVIAALMATQEIKSFTHVEVLYNAEDAIDLKTLLYSVKEHAHELLDILLLQTL
jgi:hypothetical protein